MVWVVAYIGLGYLAGGQIGQASEILGNALGLLASLALTLGLGWLLCKRTHRHPAP